MLERMLCQIPTLFNIFLERIMTDALKDLEGTVSICNVCSCAYTVQGLSTNKAVQRLNQIHTFIATTLQEQIEEN